jgi:hypothetical protein
MGEGISYSQTDCELDWWRPRGVRNGILQASALILHSHGWLHFSGAFGR